MCGPIRSLAASFLQQLSWQVWGIGGCWPILSLVRDRSISCHRGSRRSRRRHRGAKLFSPALHFKDGRAAAFSRATGGGRKWAERLLVVNSDASVSTLQTWYQLFIKKPDVLEAFIAGLRKARLSE